MISKRHLSKAPIKEALIDIQVALSDDFSVDTLDSCYDRIKNEYPVHEAIQQQIIGFRNEGNESSKLTFNHNVAGYRYTSSDGACIAQFRQDGFTFSRLAPYDTWEEMKERAEIMWNIYSSIVSPISITRIATRYINILKLPLNAEFKTYLTAPPSVPAGVSQALSGFLTRVEFGDESGARCILTQALESVTDDYVPVVVDIDTFVSKSFDVESGAFWENLEHLRNFKNTVFFESITEEAMELFQ